jgi:hypothetical protein
VVEAQMALRERAIRLGWRLQVVWFMVAFVGGVMAAVYDWFSWRDPSRIATALPDYLLMAYLPIAGLLLLAAGACLGIGAMRVYLRYFVWVRLVYPVAKQLAGRPALVGRVADWFVARFFDPCWDDHIYRSFVRGNRPRDYPGWVQAMSAGRAPVVVRREDLMERWLLANWAFAVVLLFNKITIRRQRAGDDGWTFRLEVDLRNQSYGIYNNAGKWFLREKFGQPEWRRAWKERAAEESDRALGFLSGGPAASANMDIDCSQLPLRWASGGVLPLARWRGREWFVFFFRDIEPVGWNIANGASECKEEYKNLYGLMWREFAEEVVVVDSDPGVARGMQLKQREFTAAAPFPNLRPLTNGPFARRHQAKRRQLDGLHIELEGQMKVDYVQTPFSVKVSYHDRTLRDTVEAEVRNVLFSINPGEMGIEVLLAARFEMQADDYLMDGEISEVGAFPVRRPIMLLSCDYVAKVYGEQRSVGGPSRGEPHLDGRCFDSIPAGEYALFDADAELRRRRVAALGGGAPGTSFERRRLQRWIALHEQVIDRLRRGEDDIVGCEMRAFRSLCPVTWKALELLYRHSLL